MQRFCRQLLHFLPLLLLTWLSAASLTNRTIDDELGDSATGLKPTYSPENLWAQGSQCSGCHIAPVNRGGQVQVDDVYDGTWHDTTFAPATAARSVTVTFNGTAVYVYNLIANVVPGTTTFTNLTFFIDDTFSGRFSHLPDSESPIIQYGVLVFSKTDLSIAVHTLSMVAEGSESSLVLFDRVVYTTGAESDDGSGISPTAIDSPLALSTSKTVANSSSAPSTSQTTADSSSVPSKSIGALALSSSLTTGMTGATASSSSKQSNTAIALGAAVGAAVGVLTAILILAVGVYISRKRGFSFNWSILPTKWCYQNPRPASGASSTSVSSSIPIFEQASTVYLSPVPSLSPSPLPSPISARQQVVEIRTSVPSRRRETLLPVSPDIPTPRSGFQWDYSRLVRPSHRPDVPAPALTATGTEHSNRLQDLTEQIRVLEEGMRDLRGEKKGKGRSQESLPRDGSASFNELKERVRRLRKQLEYEQRLMAEALPRDGKW